MPQEHHGGAVSSQKGCYSPFNHSQASDGHCNDSNEKEPTARVENKLHGRLQ